MYTTRYVIARLAGVAFPVVCLHLCNFVKGPHLCNFAGSLDKVGRTCQPIDFAISQKNTIKHI